MRQPHMSIAEAGQPESFQRLSHGLDYGRDGHNDAVDDDEVYLSIVEGFLPREASEQHISVAKIFRLRNPRAEGCRHDGRLDQQKSHVFLAPGIVGFVAGKTEKHCTEPTSRYRSHRIASSSQNVARHGEFFVPERNRGLVA